MVTKAKTAQCPKLFKVSQEGLRSIRPKNPFRFFRQDPQIGEEQGANGRLFSQSTNAKRRRAGRFLHRRYSPDEKSSVSAHPFWERFSFWEDFRIQLKKLPSDLFSPKSFGLDRFFGLLNESFSLNLRPRAFRFRL